MSEENKPDIKCEICSSIKDVKSLCICNDCFNQMNFNLEFLLAENFLLKAIILKNQPKDENKK